MTQSKWIYLTVCAVLLATTAASGAMAIRYRGHMLAAKADAMMASARAALLEGGDGFKEWAPGLHRAYDAVQAGIKPTEIAKSYTSKGSFMGYRPRNPVDSGRLKYDEKAIPTVLYGDTYHYNPVTIAQFALQEWGGTNGPTSQFDVAIEKLLQMQREDGAFPYDFPFKKYASGEIYEPGWTSGMAQGWSGPHFTGQPAVGFRH